MGKSSNKGYAIYNCQAVKLLVQVQAFLTTYKSRRAELILRDYERLTPRNGKYTKELKSARSRFEKAVLATTPGSTLPEQRLKIAD